MSVLEYELVSEVNAHNDINVIFFVVKTENIELTQQCILYFFNSDFVDV